MGLEDLTPEEFEALSEADRQAMLSGEGEDSPVVPEPAPAPAPEAPESATATESSPAPASEEPEARKGDPGVPLRQEREARRRLEAELTQLQTQAQQMQHILTNPQALQGFLKQQGMLVDDEPELVNENPDAIRRLVEQQVAPLQQEIQRLQMERQQMAMQQRQAQFQARFQDAPEAVAEFDQAFPHLARRYGFEEKYFMLKGMQTLTPRQAAEQAAEVEQQALAKATQIAQQQLSKATGKAQPVTLSGVTPARGNDEDLDPSAISPEQWETLPEDQRQKILRG